MESALMLYLCSNILIGGDDLFALDFPKITYLNFLNLLPCSGLVKKSPHISSVGQCAIITSPKFSLSFTNKYRMLICLVLFLLDTFPFSSITWRSFFLVQIIFPDAVSMVLQELFSHNSCGITSYLATNSVSDEVLVFSFCLWGIEYRSLFPIDVIPPVWFLMSSCAAY